MITGRTWVATLLLVACGGAGTASSDATSGGAGAGSAHGGGAGDGGEATSEEAGRDDSSEQPTVPGTPVVSFDTDQFGLTSDTSDAGPARFSALLDDANPVDGSPSYELTGAPDNSPTNCAQIALGRDLLPADAGKRFRMRQKVKTSGVTAVALSLELLVDHGKGGGVTDDMRVPTDRTITGTTDWHEIALVLDAPAGSDVAVTAMRICGVGRAWFGPILLEEVGQSVPTTPHSTWGPAS